MPLDFTFAAFDAFCQQAARLPVFTVAGYLSRSTPPHTPYVILRLDVDYRESHAVQMARIAARHDLRGSFYFRAHAGQFALEDMRAVSALGHEVGYHFETLDTCRGDYGQAEALLLKHLDHLRAAGFDIHTVAAHGGTPTAPTYRANLDLFTRTPDLFERADLSGETTLSFDFTRLVYVSDARWRWQRYASYRPGINGDSTTLRTIIQKLAQPDTALVINFHPHQWFDHAASTLYYRARHRFGRRIVLLLRPLIERRRL